MKEQFTNLHVSKQECIFSSDSFMNTQMYMSDPICPNLTIIAGFHLPNDQT